MGSLGGLLPSLRLKLARHRWRRLRQVEAQFDRDYYLKRYPDVGANGIDPFRHYLQIGWREHRDPSPAFDTAFYLRRYPDVQVDGLCPLIHYALHGRREGRLTAPEPVPEPALAPPRRMEAVWEGTADRFDPAFYRARYPDVAAGGLDAEEHYRATGWREGREPNALFDGAYYLESNPDMRAAGVCPLDHYAAVGRAQQRLTQRPRPVARQVIDEALAPAEIAARHPQPEPAGGNAAHRGLGDLLAAAPAGLLLSLSHNRYLEHVGGVQNCVGDEAGAFAAAGWLYLHLAPQAPLPMLAAPRPAADVLVQVTANDRYLGDLRLTELVATLQASSSSLPRHLVIHHLMGFAPEAVEMLAQAIAPASCHIWLHDFFGLCVNPHLMRNDVAFCGAPPEDSAACGICCYGGERPGHQQRVEGLLGRLTPTIVAPSPFALALWRGKSALPEAQIRLVPNGRLEPATGTLPAPPADRSLRVGFVGMPTYGKGWFVFEDLAARHFGDQRYSFHHLGAYPAERQRNLAFHRVLVNRAERHAMAEAIQHLGIDLVVHWSQVPETFSFTAHEAIAGGAFLLARQGAGNVVALVAEQPAHGATVADEAALHDLFDSGRVTALPGARPRLRFVPSRGSAELLLAAP